jgi:hypothetical protein
MDHVEPDEIALRDKHANALVENAPAIDHRRAVTICVLSRVGWVTQDQIEGARNEGKRVRVGAHVGHHAMARVSAQIDSRVPTGW